MNFVFKEKIMFCSKLDSCVFDKSTNFKICDAIDREHYCRLEVTLSTVSLNSSSIKIKFDKILVSLPKNISNSYLHLM